jgi:multiple antibiotic resistance protein
MSLMSHVPVSDALIIFFLTLGPLKAIAPFAQMTMGTDSAFRRDLAWRATTIATVIVLAVALLGALVLGNWHVSIAAVVITASIILFFQAFHLIMQPPIAAPPTLQSGAGHNPPPLAIASFSLAIPALVTAPGVAAIAALVAIAAGDWAQKGIIIASLLGVMVLNLVTLLNIEAILKHVPPPFLKVLGWVMAVLQAALAAQYVINGLVRLGALPPLTS